MPHPSSEPFPHEYHHLASPPFQPAPNIHLAYFPSYPLMQAKYETVTHKVNQAIHLLNRSNIMNTPWLFSPVIYVQEEPSMMLLREAGWWGLTGTYKKSGWAPLKKCMTSTGVPPLSYHHTSLLWNQKRNMILKVWRNAVGPTEQDSTACVSE